MKVCAETFEQLTHRTHDELTGETEQAQRHLREKKSKLIAQ